MKKNALAVALVAGLGLAGGAAAYNYGTSLADDVVAAAFSNAALQDAENVSYEMLVASSYNWIMREGLVFDIETADNAAAITEGFTVRVALNQRCNPHNGPAVGIVSPPTNVGVCTATGDGAQFDPTWVPTSSALGDTNLVLDPAIAAQWKVTFDGYTNGNTVATFRIEPTTTTPIGPGAGVITFTWYNAHLTSLNEFAAIAAAGGSAKVDAEFWMVNVSNDARFVNSTWSRTILESREGVVACATPEPSEVDKYIDVADDFYEDQIPKTRFSWDGKLGSADDANASPFQLPLGSDYDAQVIDLGDVTLSTGAITGTGSFQYWGNGNPFNGVSDVFQTVIEAGGGNNWDAFDNIGVDDDVYLVNGTCASGNIVDQGTVSGTQVVFNYSAQEVESTGAPGFINVSGASRGLTVCGYVDTNTIIDDHNNAVSTTFYRVNMYPANGTAPGDLGTAYPTTGYAALVGSKTMNDESCVLLPLRYNGATMEIFTINPGSNSTQRSFIRLTNRGATDGYVSLEGIDNEGNRGASQVRVWVPAGASVQLDAKDLEDGTNGAVGAWGTGVGKWRAIVTAEFPGLVATSLVNTSGDRTLQNITDSDTRGEQLNRDWAEGTWGSQVGSRPADFNQEFEPDFRGDGSWTNEPGGPDADDGPAGGTTDENGNPGL